MLAANLPSGLYGFPTPLAVRSCRAHSADQHRPSSRDGQCWWLL